VELPKDEAHHLIHVLRAALGDEVRVFDGGGREWIGRVSAIGPKTASIEIAHETTPAAEPHVRLTLAIGLLKGEQMDTVVRDATMLGASKIVPLTTAHVSVPSRARKSTTVLERWRRVAIASAKQCGRAVVPLIEDATTLPDLLGRAEFGVTVMLVEPSARSSRDTPLSAAAAAASRPMTALVLIGPEGGWSKAELDVAATKGARFTTLGPRTLRAETAPTVALSGLWTLWGW
jgi:16S rRNA (uracil1498-N3)-methyltransferase